LKAKRSSLSAVRPSDFLGEEDASPFTVTATAPVWQWFPAQPSAASWYFLKIDVETSSVIREAARQRSGHFGSIRVSAKIGETHWQTSLFPNKESGGFLLPLKVAVRRAEGLEVDREVEVKITV
jgi:Domain of unknown function (DUF1905)